MKSEEIDELLHKIREKRAVERAKLTIEERVELDRKTLREFEEKYFKKEAGVK